MGTATGGEFVGFMGFVEFREAACGMWRVGKATGGEFIGFVEFVGGYSAVFVAE